MDAKQHRGRGKPISASEIGRFLYCERSWWYSLHGEESSHLEALERGTRRHERFAGEVRALERLQALIRILLWLLVMAIVVLVLGLTLGLL